VCACIYLMPKANDTYSESSALQLFISRLVCCLGAGNTARGTSNTSRPNSVLDAISRLRRPSTPNAEPPGRRGHGRDQSNSAVAPSPHASPPLSTQEVSDAEALARFARLEAARAASRMANALEQVERATKEVSQAVESHRLAQQSHRAALVSHRAAESVVADRAAAAQLSHRRLESHREAARTGMA
jgi:hypothetical protein